jgi:Protein of unknown function (DUF2934)
MANAKTGDTIAATAGRAPESLPQPATVTNGDVARRAYDRYLVRDRDHGHDVDDWLQAECDLRAEYLEMPALRLKPEQVQRLGDVERTMCQRVLDSLVNAKCLARGRTDPTYASQTERPLVNVQRRLTSDKIP